MNTHTHTHKMFQVPLKYGPLVLGLHRERNNSNNRKKKKGKRRKMSKRNKRTGKHNKIRTQRTKSKTYTLTETQRREDKKASYSITSLIHTWATQRYPAGPASQTSWGNPVRLLVGQILQTFSFKQIQVHLKHDFGGDLCVATGEGGEIKVKEWTLEIIFKENLKKN